MLFDIPRKFEIFLRAFRRASNVMILFPRVKYTDNHFRVVFPSINFQAKCLLQISFNPASGYIEDY